MTNYLLSEARKIAFDLRRVNPYATHSEILDDAVAYIEEIWEAELADIKAKLSRELKKAFQFEKPHRSIISTSIPKQSTPNHGTN